MLLRNALFLVPLIAAAQTPPKAVDDALRTRVSEFLQYHVEGKFTKAFDYVAEDTREYYFNTQKVQFLSFHIDDIKYSDRFTKATVTATVEHVWAFQGQRIQVKTPQVTTWVLEKGKWAWHYDPETMAETPMGHSAPSTAAADPNAPAARPDLSPGAIAAKARQILKGSSVDKSEITLATDKASSDQVVFHNGYPGSVQIVLDPGAKLNGFHAELDKSSVNGGEDAVVKITYEPATPEEKAPVSLRLTVLPFNQEFGITVKFAPPHKDSQDAR